MNEICKECGGECCKYVCIPMAIWLPHLDTDYLATRGVLYPDGTWRIPARCRFLTDDGRCSIYADRPQGCKDYAVDGPECKRARAIKEAM